MIETLEDVLKPTPKGWRVVTNDPVLKPFLAPGGDYTFLVAAPELLDESEPNSGNLISWSVEGNTVTLRHADTDKGPVCEIKRSVLEAVISRLAELRDRKPRAKATQTRKARVGAAPKRAGKKSRSRRVGARRG